MIESLTVVAGRYRVGELLGTGGSASVFAAHDDVTGESIALKVLHPHLVQRAAARDAFIAEARRIANLRHVNIVAVLGAGVDDVEQPPTAWIALERVEGRTLAQHVAASGPLSPDDAATLADGLLRALSAAHSSGLVHRDVSPSNVMLASSPGPTLAIHAVKLLDFGLADAAGTAASGTDELLSKEATGRTGVIGNVNYMSPEQVRGLPVDARGDVYQVAAVLHFALTGRAPFAGESAGQTMRAHLDSPPPRPSAHDSRIPRALDRIVVRGMQKDPVDRYASATAMASQLAALHDIPVIERADHPRTAAAPAVERLPTAAAEPIDVTRVLGRTVVALPAGAPTIARPGASPARIGRSSPSRWLLAVGATAAVAAVVFLASQAPTTPVAREPAAAADPPSTSEVTTPPPAPSPPAAEPPAMLTVPDLTRFTLAEAMTALVGAGFVVGDITVVDSPFVRDVVLASTPSAGHRLGAGRAVVLDVASGANIVPDVAGLDRERAAALIAEAGFIPAFASSRADAGAAAGAIVGTIPEARTPVAVGETITILESEPAAPTPVQTHPPSPTPTPTRPTPTPAPTPAGG